MKVERHHRAKGTQITGQLPDRVAMYRSARVATTATEPSPQQSAFVPAPPPTMTVRYLKSEEYGTLAPWHPAIVLDGHENGQRHQGAVTWTIPEMNQGWSDNVHSEKADMSIALVPASILATAMIPTHRIGPI